MSYLFFVKFLSNYVYGMKNCFVDVSDLKLTYPDVLFSSINKPLINFITDTDHIIFLAQISNKLQLFHAKYLKYKKLKSNSLNFCQ